MALEVLHSQSENTHENEQFRRVVKHLDEAFKQHNYDGILIGNPFNENYSRFRADAILLYNNGLVIIDFKDYQGKLTIPNGEDAFKNTPWVANQKVEIKGGSRFVNPFRQLVAYRTEFQKIIEHNEVLNKYINISRVCIINILSGPIELSSQVPGKFRYYKIVQESEIGQFVYDFKSVNSYKPEIAETLKSIFPTQTYVREYTQTVEVIEKNKVIIEENAKNAIENFVKADGNDILVLASMNSAERDDWRRYLHSISDENNIPEVVELCHSTRISQRLQKRGINADSLYAAIYGGAKTVEQRVDEEKASLQIVPLKSDNDYDEKAMIIVHEAHLICRSLNQSELLRFGSGRLLEDFIKFMNPETKRKIVFIGDPFMLTFGKSDESAMNTETLKNVCGEREIRYFAQKVSSYATSNNKEELRKNLALGVECKLFNNLKYNYNDESIVEIDTNEIKEVLEEWFSRPFENEPKNAFLFWKKDDCYKTNLWIKKNLLKNGETIAVGDLLLLCNNVNIIDQTGFGKTKKFFNGMYFTVKQVIEQHSITQPLKGRQEPIKLNFTKLAVKCLSTNNLGAEEVWLLDNFLLNEELSKDEQVALQVILNNKISEELEKHPNSSKEEKEKNRKDIERQILETDPYLNALQVKYGWAITVHKGVGSSFENVILKGIQSTERKANNENYFRWLYTGLSQCEGKFYITQALKLSPFKDCEIVESANVISTKKKLLVFDDYEILKPYAKFVSQLKPNSAAAICELAKQLEIHGFSLQKVDKKSDYLSRAHFSNSQNKSLIFNIDNKGEKDAFGVSNIRKDAMSSASLDHKLLEEIISSLFNESTIINDKTPDYIEEIYADLSKYLQSVGISCKKIESNDYQDILKLKSLRGEASLRFWYGTSEKEHSKGFISKIEILESTDNDINSKIEDYVREYK